MAINPGFALLAGALLATVLPARWRALVMCFAGIGAIFLLFSPGFGEGGAMAQLGLELAFLRLDALSQIFALAIAILTVALGMGAFSRQDRLEDVALLTHMGGACVGVCAGDIITFVAAAELSALAGVALIASRGQSGRHAGLRLLAWHALAGALLLAGAAFHLAGGGSPSFKNFDRDTVGGLLLFLGLGMRAGFPLAHVGLKDAVPHASDLGFPALLVLTGGLAAYGLIRGFAGDPMLVNAGLAMCAIGAFFAFAQGDLRKSLAYGMTGQTGLLLVAAGIGGPLALAGASALAFVTTLAGALAGFALFGVRENGEGASAAGLAMSVLAGVSLAGAPGAAGYLGLGLMLDAAQRDHRTLLWAAIAAAAAAGAAVLAVRTPMALYFAWRGQRRGAMPFTVGLGGLLLGVVCAAIGFVPDWLLDLSPPGGVVFAPFNWGPLISIGQLFAAAAAFALVCIAAGIWPKAHTKAGLDLDDVLGPIAVRGEERLRLWLEGLGERWRAFVSWLRTRLQAQAQALLSQSDRPARSSVLADAAGLLGLCAVLIFVLLSAQ
jgi:multicomponent Na+:H+ antiporter subunit D